MTDIPRLSPMDNGARRSMIGLPQGSDVARNRLLAALAPADFAVLKRHLEPVTLEINDVLAEPGEHFTHIYFPESAAVSVVTYMTDGSGVEVGTMGNEGMAGLPAYLEADASESRTFCQVRGAALRVPVDVLLDAANTRPEIRRLLNRYTQAYLSLVAQGAACNRLHTIEQRCARWLLMTHDRTVGSDMLELKQEFLALMLGVRRIGVTIAAGALQDAGLIRYRRGHIRVTDRAGLEAAACECYGVVRARFDQLLPYVPEGTQ
ncbi:MAG: Crp/Fnr family transcriptional regulator [Gemmatimonadota bacterium]|nr:Crp/Fnr family transcriptional regulator [Gemmatimonadota bacterium]